MIVVKSRLRTLAIDTDKLKQDAQKVLELLGIGDFDCGILLTTNATIKKYNNTYRNKNKPTDILSFPFYPDLKPGQRILATTQDEKNIGDLILAPEYIKKTAKKHNATFKQHLQRLLVHGICHLVGYDHIKDKDYNIMIKKEMELLKKLRGSSH